MNEICALRSELNRRRTGRQRRNRMALTIFALMFVVLAYLVAFSSECPGKDLAQLSADQRAEIVSRWHGR